ncbi:putative 1-aminocyclopropane-1-carboxylate synthase [Podospora fimiseda]|uniref:1-aminocyclopropane-1-carboxylate synthase n=1 Tax=Podospora fimiseda TaxID=252190 RepID=A0AAN7H316_9PEZI|nr:putative 1-aminocyclopropane-1-carboxylate synthase [Podospora fimiseda]
MANASDAETAAAAEFRLSSRAAHNHLHKRAWEFFEKCLATPWSPETPDGVSDLRINLGVAENAMMHKEVSSFIEQNLRVDPVSQLTYGSGPKGSPRLKRALASFLNTTFEVREAVEPEDIIIMAGVTPVIDALSWAICNEGEGIIIPRPFYTAFSHDIPTRARGVVIPAWFRDLEGYTGFDDVFDAEMNKKALQRALETAVSNGIKAKALILTHPHNPLGRCYPVETIKEIASFCGRHNLHLISDEIYAKSVFRNPKAPNAIPFTSILSLDLTDRIDSQLVHVTYGASKDFCANGLRLGMLYTRNEGLMSAIASNAMLGWPPYIVQDIWAGMLENQSFLNDFLETNQKQLAEQYAITTQFLDEQGIPYFANSNAGMFLWIDLRRLLCGMHWSEERLPDLTVRRLSAEDKEKYLKKEQDIFNRCGENKVLLACGSAFSTEELGWFRLTFTPTRDALYVGLSRLKDVFDQLRQEV